MRGGGKRASPRGWREPAASALRRRRGARRAGGAPREFRGVGAAPLPRSPRPEAERRRWAAAGVRVRGGPYAEGSPRGARGDRGGPLSLPVLKVLSPCLPGPGGRPLEAAGAPSSRSRGSFAVSRKKLGGGGSRPDPRPACRASPGGGRVRVAAFPPALERFEHFNTSCLRNFHVGHG